MEIDRERLALAILNDDRKAGGLPARGSRVDIPNSDGYLRNVDAILADITAQGWVLVPRVATEEMLDAAANTPGMKAASSAMEMYQARGYGFAEGSFDAGSPLQQAWSAMIEAVHPIHEIARD